MNFDLRNYQEEASEGIRRMLSTHKRAILCSPTGSGKTIIALHLAWRASLKPLTTVFLTDRIELINQTFNKFHESRGSMNFQFYSKDSNYVYKDCHIYLSMVETFHRRQSQGKFNKKVDLFILDECHIGNYCKVMDANPNAMVIGLTATPVTSDKFNLKDYYGDVFMGRTVPSLIKDGYLVPSIDYTTHDVLAMKLQAGEFTALSQVEAFKRQNSQQKLKEFLKKQKKRKWICFGINVAHSLETTDFLRKTGYNAVHVDSKDPDRDQKIMDYKNGTIEILCNVGITTKGFDDPETSGVILNHSTASLSRYYQEVGRGCRPAPGKDHFIVFDLGNNIFRHGSYNDEMDWRAVFEDNKRNINDQIKYKYSCNHCGLFVRNKHLNKCPDCGSPFPEFLLQIEKPGIPAGLEYITKLLPEQLNYKELLLYAEYKGWKRGFAWVQWQKNSVSQKFWQYFNGPEGRADRGK
jgi:hypothetical protein